MKTETIKDTGEAAVTVLSFSNKKLGQKVQYLVDDLEEKYLPTPEPAGLQAEPSLIPINVSLELNNSEEKRLEIEQRTQQLLDELALETENLELLAPDLEVQIELDQENRLKKEKQRQQELLNQNTAEPDNTDDTEDPVNSTESSLFPPEFAALDLGFKPVEPKSSENNDEEKAEAEKLKKARLKKLKGRNMFRDIQMQLNSAGNNTETNQTEIMPSTKTLDDIPAEQPFNEAEKQTLLDNIEQQIETQKLAEQELVQQSDSRRR